MPDGEVVGRGIRRFCILIRKWRSWVPDDLAVTMVLHQDDKHMVEVWNALGNGTFLREQATCE